MLTKQPVAINFAQGLDTKTDPWQVQAGKFLSLENSVFTKGGLLQKRNGYELLGENANTPFSLTTFNDGLVAFCDPTTITDSFLTTYSGNSGKWTTSSNPYIPLELNTVPVYRSGTNQSYCDSAVLDGLVCTSFTDNAPSGGSTTASYKFIISDLLTGQNIITPAVISGATGPGRVFAVGNYFVIIFTALISATQHLQYIAISATNPTIATSPVDISTTYVPVSNSTNAFDAVVYNDNLYISWCATSSTMKTTYLDRTLTIHNTVTFTGGGSVLTSVCADSTNGNIYTYFNDATNTYQFVTDKSLNVIHNTQTISTTANILNIASWMYASKGAVYLEVDGAYSYDASIHTHKINAVLITNSTTAGAETTIARGLGLASKAFEGSFLGVYSSTFQPTYFLCSSKSSDDLSTPTVKILSKLAYQNAGGYLTHGLPNVNFTQSFPLKSSPTGTIYVPYLIKDSISSVNASVVGGVSVTPIIYSQTGINLATMNVLSSVTAQNNPSIAGGTVVAQDNSPVPVTAEIGSNLHISGGFLWDFDGINLVENNFFLYPDVTASSLTVSTTGGSMTAQTYFYQAIYSWTDNNGITSYSTPSIPQTVTTTGSTSKVTINVPTLRQTYKTQSKVNIRIYRWSTAQQIYYEVTSIAIPLQNDTTVDSVSFVDTQADSAIIGNSIIYTTGNVIENVSPPATNILGIFQSRLFLVDAEDPNLLWFSKQIIEDVPVEFSDLLTIYVTPTIGAQGSTGPITALSPMDDKLVIWKKNAAYYINGTGPDNTGSNNQFSEPIYISSTVGTSNQNSVVLIPSGIMFQSDKGIWLLGRDLSTSYIGAPVESFTQDATVLSAITIPGTNQVRFTLDSGYTLVYDYYYQQWSTFVGIPGISSTLYQGLHTYADARGNVFQETPGQYLDGSKPVLLQFTTSWLNMAGLQGYQRAYFFYLIGQYMTPHRLQVSVAYDYNPSPQQSNLIQPDNFSSTYGTGLINSPYGQSATYGGSSNVEQWRVFLNKQRCQSFQITLQEVYDPTFGVPAGAGLTLSGLNVIAAFKSSFVPFAAKNTVGGS